MDENARMEGDGTGTVVVGFDGSPGSEEALEHALREAARRQARLRIVTAVQLPDHDYWASTYMTGTWPAPGEVVESVRAKARRHVDDVGARHPEFAALVPTMVEVVAGPPAEVLVDASQGADLLVVGHRGRGAFASALLGSVGLRCLLHAACPVTIVRAQPVPAVGAATAAPSAVGSVRA